MDKATDMAKVRIDLSIASLDIQMSSSHVVCQHLVRVQVNIRPCGWMFRFFMRYQLFILIYFATPNNLGNQYHNKLAAGLPCTEADLSCSATGG